MKWFRRNKRTQAPTGHGVADFWGEKAREKTEDPQWTRNLWQSHPITHPHLNRLMTGNPQQSWLPFIKDKYCTTPREHVLSLGCGEGIAEREMLRLGVCQVATACDISPQAVDLAREQAKRSGYTDRIHYHVLDLNASEVPPARYDLILVNQALHHIERLEKVISDLHRTLTNNGVLVLNEYVGPARFQWTAKANDLMNELLNLLPQEKRFIRNGQYYRDQIVRPTPEQVAAVDPSESVRSDEILPILKQHFETDYFAPFGGTLLQFLLSDIIANFDEKDDMDRAVIDMLVHFEETLIKEGVIKSDFVFAVMRPRAI